MKRPESLDLLIVFVVTIAAISAGLNGGILRALAGLLLIFILPGYVLTALAFPRQLPRPVESFVYTVGLSLAVTILGGLVLNATQWGLQNQSWTVFLGVFTLAVGLVAWLRRQGQFRAQPIRRPMTLNPTTPVLMGLAVIVTISALMLARSGAENTPTPGFTQFWMLPGNRGSVRLGVKNEEITTLSYQLVVSGGEQIIQQWTTITIKPGETWEAALPLPDTPFEKIDAQLYRIDALQTVYRKASLYLGGGSGALCVWRDGLCEF